jgi:hypothetical protein
VGNDVRDGHSQQLERLRHEHRQHRLRCGSAARPDRHADTGHAHGNSHVDAHPDGDADARWPDGYVDSDKHVHTHAHADRDSDAKPDADATARDADRDIR